MINNSNINNEHIHKPKKVIDNVFRTIKNEDVSYDLEDELFNNVEDLIYISDENYNIISGNKAFTEKYGNDYINKKCHEVLFKSKHRCTWCQLNCVKQTKKPQCIDHYNSIDDCWNEYKFSYLKNNDGKDLNIITIHNIDKRKELEENILETSLKFQTITDLAQDAIIMIDQKGDINYWNLSAKRIFGYSKEEVIGKNVHKLLAPPQYHDAINENFTKFQLTGEGNALNKTLEMKAYNKNKEEIHIELSVSTLTLKGKINAVAVIRDITERKELELQQKRQQEELKQTIEELEIMRFSVDNSALAVVWIDSKGNILKTNKKLAEITGYTNEELTNMKVFDLDYELTSEDWQDFWNACREQKGTVIEASITRKDGFTFPIEVSGQYQEFKGKRYVFVNAKDITERKRVKELLTDQNEELLNYKEILEETIQVMEKSEEKYTCLFEHMREGMLIGKVIYNKEGDPNYVQILDINPAYEKICSVKRKDVINSLFSEVHGNEEIPFWDQMVDVINHKKVVNLITYWEFLKKYLKIVIFPIDNDQFALVMSDITSLRISDDKLNKEIHEMHKKEVALIAREKELSKEKDDYYNILESMTLAACVLELVYNKNSEPIDIKILFVNKAYEEHKCCNRDDMVGKLGRAIYGSEHPFLNYFIEVAETGQTKTIEHYFHTTDKHFKIDIKDLGNGKLGIFATDISEHKLIETQLTKQDQQNKIITEDLEETRHRLLENIAYFESLINGIIDAAYICSDDYTIEFANNAFIEKYGTFLPTDKCYNVIFDRDEICPWCQHEACKESETISFCEAECKKLDEKYDMIFSPIFQMNDNKASMIILYEDKHYQKTKDET